VINTGDCERARSIESLWQSGEEVRGWPRRWASLYGFVLAEQAQDEVLSRQILSVRYEDLCNTPDETLAQIFAHVGLELSSAMRASLADVLSQPNYYRPSFTARRRKRCVRKRKRQQRCLVTPIETSGR
jgi:uncharacterized membrane protein YcgQ (UPF0703/DUF1980 family)